MNRANAISIVIVDEFNWFKMEWNELHMLCANWTIDSCEDNFIWTTANDSRFNCDSHCSVCVCELCWILHCACVDGWLLGGWVYGWINIWTDGCVHEKLLPMNWFRLNKWDFVEWLSLSCDRWFSWCCFFFVWLTLSLSPTLALYRKMSYSYWGFKEIAQQAQNNRQNQNQNRPLK